MSCWLGLWTIAGSAETTGRDWALSGDGAYVIHRDARMAWPRCVEGTAWNGRRCTGAPLLMDRQEALALARARSEQSGVTWRLPHVKELQQLASASALASSRDGAALLPAASHGWCWSATAVVDTRGFNEYNYGNVSRGLNKANVNQLGFLHGWAVNTVDGEARGDVPKRTKLSVRLVLPLD
ncbi:MAG: hypothetical protein KIT60_07305 [Burkholderiaceae bacterium]|nr:hypothetical protein [Burkholderiaceae bacterium]